MPSIIMCPECKRKLQNEPRFAGRKIRCKCGKIMRVAVTKESSSVPTIAPVSGPQKQQALIQVNSAQAAPSVSHSAERLVVGQRPRPSTIRQLGSFVGWAALMFLIGAGVLFVAALMLGPRNDAIPSDVSYAIIETNIVPGAKRALDVRINRRVSKEVLRSIALTLKKADRRTYDRTFLGYYLPNMKINEGYWATTHFTPSLEVRILGHTPKQEAEH